MKNRKFFKWSIWLLAALFYFYEFILRVSPSVMVNELMQSFNITASGVGVLAAFYLYSYAPMQLPVGVLMDHFGIKKVLSWASIICGCGAIIFAFSNQYSYAAIGRFLIGVGSSFAFIAIVYVSTNWFSEKKSGFLIGIANSLAMFGAFAGTGPLSNLVQTFGYKKVIAFFGFVGLIIGFLVFFIFKLDTKEEKKDVSHHREKLLKNIILVGSNKYIWINGIVALLLYVTTTAFGGLWGQSFIEKAYNVSKDVSGYAVSMIFFGWLFGGPIVGFLSDMINDRKKTIRVAFVLTILFLVPVIYFPHFHIYIVYFLLFLVGFFSSAELLCFSVAIKLANNNAKATAAAFTNFLISCGDALVQPLVGFLLDLNWKGTLLDGIRNYSVLDYQKAITVLPAALILGFILIFFLKENNSLNKN